METDCHWRHHRFVGQLMNIEPDDMDLEDGGVISGSNVACQGRLSDHSDQIYCCTMCECSFFCDKCWTQEPAHKRVDCAHERSRLDDLETVYDALHLKKDNDKDSKDKQSEKASGEYIRKSDADNMWFGVSGPQGENKDYFLYEGIAYEDLMLAGPSTRPSTTSPSLVSFIGETGTLPLRRQLSTYLWDVLPQAPQWSRWLIQSRLWEERLDKASHQGDSHSVSLPNQCQVLIQHPHSFLLISGGDISPLRW
jgi:hypothetical protein